MLKADIKNNVNDSKNNETDNIKPNLQEAQKFLSLLDGEAEVFTFQTFADTPQAKENSSQYARIFSGTLDEYAKKLTKLNQQGAGVFVTVQETDGEGRKKENITRIRAIFQEDDEGSDTRFPVDPHITVQSSPNKYHRYFLTEGASPHEFEAVQRRMVEDYGSDPSAKDRARVLRLPGFYHQKDPNKPHMVHIVKSTAERPIPWDRLKTAFPPVGLEGRRTVASASGKNFLTNPAEILSALGALDPDCDYNSWLRVGMALHSTKAGSAAFELWDQWSVKGHKYRDGETAKMWETFNSNCPNGVKLGTLFHMAKQAGWTGSPPIAPPISGSANNSLISLGTDGLPDLTHDQLALDLSAKYGWQNNAKYVAKQGNWFFWNGTVWSLDQKQTHITQTRSFIRDLALDVEKWAKEYAQNIGSTDEANKFEARWKSHAKNLRQRSFFINVANTAQSNSDLIAAPKDFDSDPMLVGTPGGTVDLRSGTLRAAERGDLITRQVAVTPASLGAHAAQWEAFLAQTQEDDAEMVGFLKRLCGYALTGLTSEHKLPFIFGTGGNGKSVFCNTIHQIMGEYATRTPAETFLANRGPQHPTDLASMEGKRLVTAAELPVGATWNESLLKDLTGGDLISARRMRQDFFEFSPECTVFMIGNQKPALRTVDDAMRRRLLLIPFTRQISDRDRDPDLMDKLKAEWPAILRWMIDGAIEWQKQGLNAPQRVVDASRDYLDSEDTLKEFMTDCLEKTDKGFVLTKDVYSAFKQWCEERGMTPWTQQSLTKSIRNRGFDVTRQSSGYALNGFKVIQENLGISPVSSYTSKKLQV
ncbi:putative DNA primase/helicase [Natronocella acetinitrilica]|uniref:DNA primase/helicase n=1 Tax=Natronocella acetinitrilica TaxID=414046 RepID=A0AAE3G7U7_9GAMM|nr:phage/plasmid primase, P4 family [Natronocella acetinitrilica]MCP1676649.1 putative DNA primase/helicase [Natronocella acetinitrilica]